MREREKKLRFDADKPNDRWYCVVSEKKKKNHYLGNRATKKCLFRKQPLKKLTQKKSRIRQIISIVQIEFNKCHFHFYNRY